MQWGKVGKEVDKTTIVLNSRLRLSGIPAEVFDYVVNGKSALEWVMKRYHVITDHKEAAFATTRMTGPRSRATLSIS
jgi:predicted helicase